MVLCQIVQNRPKKLLWVKNRNQHPNLNPCAKSELNWSRNKKMWKICIFIAATRKKLEMALHSDNDYDVTNSFARFEKFLAYTLFL